MKSGLRQLQNKMKRGGPPVPTVGRGRRGSMFDLGVGRMSKTAQLETYRASGTVFSIVSLLQSAPAWPPWHLYKKQPVDGRRRYTTTDKGSDQRTEVIQHAAIKLWNQPNMYMSGFEFREGCNQHLELTGETFWVVQREIFNIPTAMWYVRPDRMEPIATPDDYIIGWMYTGPDGESVPLKFDEVIQERMPDPTDQFRGAGPVGSIMSNIEQQKYATEYQRNLFYNGADPGGILAVPNRLTEPEFDELIDRWRETHQGIARAGRVGVLENGITWAPAGHTNKDLEYGNLRLMNRDEIREAWRMHKTMLGTADDVNRANAQTAEEVFVGWMTLPRLERRKNTLNYKLLPMFGDDTVEFDYEDPSPDNREADNAELTAKTQAALTLIQALVSANRQFEINDVMTVVGLPEIKTEDKPEPKPVTNTPDGGNDDPGTEEDKQLQDVLKNLRQHAAWNAAIGR